MSTAKGMRFRHRLEIYSRGRSVLTHRQSRRLLKKLYRFNKKYLIVGDPE